MALLPPLVIVGPTGSGKSVIALRLARERNAGIVSCDSVQVYRELVVGANQPSAEDRAAVEHFFCAEASVLAAGEHDAGASFAAGEDDDAPRKRKPPDLTAGFLARLAPPRPATARGNNQEFSAADFAERAVAAALALRSRGKNVIVCGGSMCYADHFLRHCGARAMLRVRGGEEEEEAEADGGDSGDSSTRDSSTRDWLARPAMIFLCPAERSELMRQIDARCEAMLRGNLLPEVGDLLRQVPRDNFCFGAIGYRQAAQLVDGTFAPLRVQSGVAAALASRRCAPCCKASAAAAASLEPLALAPAAQEFITFFRTFAKATRDYAKKQATWYRRRPEVLFVAPVYDDVVALWQEDAQNDRGGEEGGGEIGPVRASLAAASEVLKGPEIKMKAHEERQLEEGFVAEMCAQVARERRAWLQISEEG